MTNMPHWPKSFIRHHDVKDLSRMEMLAKELGDPHLNLPPVIHVAGTNGKGSTCAMLKAIFEASGKTVHMYTSPHLIHFNERIVVGGHAISDEDLFKYLEEVRSLHEKLDLVPSFFEATTLAAFLAFSRNKADILILETGMGGRLDPTNIVPNPIMTIITPVSYDHMEYLGPSIGMIAREKAGIIKPGAKCIISMQEQEAMDVLLEKCEQMNVESIAYEYDFIAEKSVDAASSQIASQPASHFTFRSVMGDLAVDRMNMIGDHQIINATTVIASIFALKDSFDISNESIKLGLVKANWPGRLQKVSLAKFGAQNLRQAAYAWLDGAHNIAGARALNNWISESFGNGEAAKPLLIVGMTKNRDVIAFLSEFESEFETPLSEIYSVPVMSEADSYSAEKLADIALKAGIQVSPKPSLAIAIEEALQSDPSRPIIITGSLYLVADFLRL